MATHRSLSTFGILFISLLAQASGHLLLKHYMPNAAVGGLGFLLVAIIFFYVLLIRRDVFGFILVVYICSHFSYADNQGGLWNLMTFGMLSIFFMAGGQRNEGFTKKDIPMSIFMSIFILWNIFGWATKNPLPILPLLQGVAAFFGLIFMFKLTSNVAITPERFRQFLTVTFFMVIYQFLVALNQRYTLIDLNTPMLGAYSEKASIGLGVKITSGTLRHFELFGEYGLLLSCLLLPLLSSSVTQQELRFGSNRIVVMIFICLSYIMLTSNRAAALLFVFAVFIYYLIFTLRFFPVIDRVGRQARLWVVVLALVPVIGIYVGLDQLQEDFAELAPGLNKMSVESVVSGKSINRGALVDAGLERLKTDSWLFGFGYGIPRSNIWAWFGLDPEVRIIGVADLHSLYLSLPELFGWVGSIAFIALIILTGLRSFGTSIRYRQRKDFLQVLTIGFTVFWLIFLINEYKISIFRNPNYQMLFWIWLGLSNSVIKTIRQYNYNNKLIKSVDQEVKA